MNPFIISLIHWRNISARGGRYQREENIVQLLPKEKNRKWKTANSKGCDKGRWQQKMFLNCYPSLRQTELGNWNVVTRKWRKMYFGFMHGIFKQRCVVDSWVWKFWAIRYSSRGLRFEELLDFGHWNLCPNN